MTNILFISGRFGNAGTETFMMNVVRNSNPDLFHYDFLIFSQATSRNAQEAEALGCHVYRLPSRREGFFKHIRAVNHFFSTHANTYQVIHWCGGNLSSIYALYAARKHHIPKRILHAHSSSAQGLHNKVLHFVNKFFVHCFVSDYLACSSAAAKYFYDNKPCTIIQNGINLGYYEYDPLCRKAIRDELHIADQQLVVGHVGRFDYNKNQTFLLDILRSLHDSYPQALLLLIGTGSTLDSVKQRAIPLMDNVRFLGERNDVYRLYQAMDCFVMPSLFEGLPFVLVEAQAAGLPCVVSDTVNKDVQLTDRLYFKSLQDSSDKWAECILDAINRYPRADTSAQLRTAGFDIKQTIKQLENIYTEHDTI